VVVRPVKNALYQQYTIKATIAWPVIYSRYNIGAFYVELLAGTTIVAKIDYTTKDKLTELYVQRQTGEPTVVDATWQVIGNAHAGEKLSIHIHTVGKKEENEIIVFDSVAICESSDRCDEKYPKCTDGGMDLLLLIDQSGSASDSIVDRKKHFDKAIEFLEEVYDTNQKRTENHPGKGSVTRIRVEARTFSDQNDENKLVVGTRPMEILDAQGLAHFKKTFTEAANVRHNDRVNTPTALGYTVRKAMNRLNGVMGQGSSKGKQLISIITITDGDMSKTEGEVEFEARMKEFSMAAQSALFPDREVCLYNLQVIRHIDSTDPAFIGDKLFGLTGNAYTPFGSCRKPTEAITTKAQIDGPVALADYLFANDESPLLSKLTCSKGPDHCDCIADDQYYGTKRVNATYSFLMTYHHWIDQCCESCIRPTSSTTTSSTTSTSSSTCTPCVCPTVEAPETTSFYTSIALLNSTEASAAVTTHVKTTTAAATTTAAKTALPVPCLDTEFNIKTKDGFKCSKKLVCKGKQYEETGEPCNCKKDLGPDCWRCTHRKLASKSVAKIEVQGAEDGLYKECLACRNSKLFVEETAQCIDVESCPPRSAVYTKPSGLRGMCTQPFECGKAKRVIALGSPRHGKRCECSNKCLHCEYLPASSLAAGGELASKCDSTQSLGWPDRLCGPNRGTEVCKICRRKQYLFMGVCVTEQECIGSGGVPKGKASTERICCTGGQC